MFTVADHVIFDYMLRADESPLEPGDHGEKWFAPGVRLIRDDDLKLTKIEPTPSKK